jgi:hypothetical protein
VALKYEGEEEYRYLIASDLSWRTEDVVGGHTYRWLIEIFHSQCTYITDQYLSDYSVDLAA